MIDQMTETRIEEIIEEENDGCYCEMVHPDTTCNWCLTYAGIFDQPVEVF